MSAETEVQSNGAPLQALAAPDRMNTLFAELMARYPEKGLGSSSMGKFDKIRRWLADEFGLDDWEHQTYAVGASTAAHNFKSR